MLLVALIELLAVRSAIIPQATVVAQSIDPTVIIDLPGPVRAVASFLLILLFGSGLLYRYEDLVNRSIDASMDHNPAIAAIYGVFAYIIILFFGGYAFSQLARAGVTNPTINTAVMALIGGVLLSLAGLGFLIIGTLVTIADGARRPRIGLLVGATVSAVGWLVLPFPAGLAVWVLIAAVGIGGATRNWVHSSG
ncbi:MAG: hypothetical protein ABEJ48_03285 [Halobacteriales archaeon]